MEHLKRLRTYYFSILINKFNYSIRDISKAVKIPKSTVHQNLYRYLSHNQMLVTQKHLQEHTTNNKPIKMCDEIKQLLYAIERTTLNINNKERSKNQ